MSKKILNSFILMVSLLVLISCKVNYSFTGASIPKDAQTFSVQPFMNVSTMVVPILATTLTDALQDRMQRQTRLTQVKEDGDLAFEGEIVNYISAPIAVTGDEYATLNRLTVTVKVRFTNRQQPEYNFDKSFSAYEDYDSNKLMQEVEPVIIPQIVEKLVEDIFNAALSNW